MNPLSSRHCLISHRFRKRRNWQRRWPKKLPRKRRRHHPLRKRKPNQYQLVTDQELPVSRRHLAVVRRRTRKFLVHHPVQMKRITGWKSAVCAMDRRVSSNTKDARNALESLTNHVARKDICLFARIAIRTWMWMTKKAILAMKNNKFFLSFFKVLIKFNS